MAEQTDNYGLTLPDEDDFYNVEDFNGNMEKIDTEIKTAQDKADQAFQSASNGKTLIKNAITGVDNSITVPTNPTFQQLADCIEEIEIDPYADKGVLTGKSVQFTEADNGLIEITGIQGKYSQAVTVQGKNLLDSSKLVQGGLGTAGTEYVATTRIRSDFFKVIANDKIIASLTQANIPIYYFFYDSAKNQISNSGDWIAINTVVTAPANTAYARILLRKNDNTDILPTDVSNVQVELGTVATPYAAHVPNSPSPDYPSPILNVGDTSFKIGVCGKNLFPPLNSITNLGITLTQSLDGTITLNGTSTNVALFYIPVYIPLVGDYNLSANNTAISTISIKLSRNSSGGNYIRDMVLDSVNKSLAFSVANDVISYIGVRVPSGVTLTNYIIKPQLETGSISTPYETYKGNQTPVTGQYGALPDGTRDEFVSDGITAKKIQRKGRIVFNGSESWQASGADTSSYYANTSIENANIYVANNLVANILCDKLKPYSYNDLTINIKPNYGISCRGNVSFNTITVRCPAVPAGDYNAFKTWLAANPITVDYALATPIETPRDRILNTSYKGITNAYTNDSLQPTFTAVAKSELWSGRKLVIPGAIKNADSKVVIPTNATFAQLAAAIGQIQTGIDTKDATAIASQILAGMTAYVNDIKLTGTMQNRGAVSQSLPINSSYIIPQGYHNGSGSVSQSIPTKAAATYNPSTSAQTIAAGQYLSGAQTIAPTTGTANAGQALSGYTFNSGYGIGLTGNIPIVNPDYADQTVASNVSVGASSGDGLNYAYLNHGLSGKYSNGANWVRRYEPYLRSENILSGASIMGINGTAIAGKRFATGTVTSSAANTGTFYDGATYERLRSYVSVSGGYAFTPSRIIVMSYGSDFTYVTMYDSNGVLTGNDSKIAVMTCKPFYENGTGHLGAFKLSGTASVTGTGFTLPCDRALSVHTWIAYE